MSLVDFEKVLDANIAQMCPDPDAFSETPFTIAAFRNHLVFEFIKDAYAESEPKSSLRAYRRDSNSDSDDVRMRDSRQIEYAQYYRTAQNSHITKLTGRNVSELQPPEMGDISDKLSGYSLTRMQYFELETMSRLSLLKAIISKRISNVKKVSNSQFRDYMEEYEKEVSELLEQLDHRETLVFATIALFTLEWKYSIELFYTCAVQAEVWKCKEVPTHKVATLCAELAVPLAPDFNRNVYTESRYIKNRQSLVPAIYDGSDWFPYEGTIGAYLTISYVSRKELLYNGKPLFEFFMQTTSAEEWAEFISKHYDLRNAFQKKEWTNSRIRYVRMLYEELYKNIRPPKLG